MTKLLVATHNKGKVTEFAEMLQDMVLSAVNMALDESRALQEKLMGPLAGGLPF